MAARGAARACRRRDGSGYEGNATAFEGQNIATTDTTTLVPASCIANHPHLPVKEALTQRLQRARQRECKDHFGESSGVGGAINRAAAGAAAK